MRAIGGAAVVNRLAHFCLDNCGAWVGAAAQPIAAKARSYRVSGAPAVFTAMPDTPVGVPLACDRRRSRRKPADAIFLTKSGAWVGAAAQPIAAKARSYKVTGAPAVSSCLRAGWR